MGLTTLPLSCADCLDIWEPHPPGTLRVCLGLKWDCFTFTFLIGYFRFVTFHNSATTRIRIFFAVLEVLNAVLNLIFVRNMHCGLR